MRHLRRSTAHLTPMAAVVELLIGLDIFLFPQGWGAQALGPLQPYEAWLTSGLLQGGIAGLMLGRYSLPHRLDRVITIAAVAPLPLMAFASAQAGSWWAATLFGLLGVLLAASLWLAHQTGADEQTPTPPVDPTAWDTLPEQLERVLELWLWLIALSVALVAPFHDGGIMVTPEVAAIFVVGVVLYNLIAVRRLSDLEAPVKRVGYHLVFVTLSTGLLVADHGLLGHALLGPFLVVIPLGTRVLGVRKGLALLGLAVASMLGGGLATWLLKGAPLKLALWETGMDLAGLLTAAVVGIGSASVQRKVAMELAAARQTMQREVRQRELSETITVAIRSSLDLDRILQTTVNQLGAALAVDRCSVRLMSTGEVNAPVHQYAAAGVPLLGEYRPQGLITQLLNDRKAIAIDDVATDPILGARDAADRQLVVSQGIKSILVAPIIAEDELLGTLAFHQLSHARHWEREEIEFLEGVAGQVAVAIAHAWEHEALGRSLAQLQAMHADLQGAHEELQAHEEELVAQQEELQAQQEELEESLEQTRMAEAAHSRLSAILEATSDLVAMSDMNRRRMYMNKAGRTLLGFDETRPVEGQEIGNVHPEWARNVILSEAIPTAIRQGIWRGESAYVAHDGREIPVSQVVIAHKGLDGEPVYISTIARDISERKQMEQQLVHMASYDPLTDMFNRRRFEEELVRYLGLAHRYGTVGALLFIDLDQFKYINDTLGHQAGDLFLKGLSGMLRRRLRKTDVLARLGGDEFAILLPQTDPAQAQSVAEDVRKAIRRYTQVISGQPISTTASIGLAIFPEHGSTVEELLSRADMAMYQAKEHGRNRLQLFVSGTTEQEKVTSKLTWERRIREALTNDRFVLHQQPILDLKTGQVVRHELLLRMLDEEGRICPPMAFLDTAERFGLIRAIDRWVVRRAIHLIQERSKHNPDICLEVNLSGRAFEDPDLLSIIKRELEQTLINPRSLVLEITETAAIADLEQAARFVTTLRELGCRFAIDDFGSGFASFYYLKHLPVDYLKLDGSFIRNLPNDPVDQHLVRAMVEVARGLGKRTIAEFVESEETVRLLNEYGVDFAQGYYVGRPVPLEENCDGVTESAGLD